MAGGLGPGPAPAWPAPSVTGPGRPGACAAPTGGFPRAEGASGNARAHEVSVSNGQFLENGGTSLSEKAIQGSGIADRGSRGVWHDL